MHCEFCDMYVEVADVKRHLLLASHTRKRRDFDLNISKFVERIRQAAIRPNDFEELNTLLNIRSAKNVEDMNEGGFFEIDSPRDSKIAREMIRVLFSNSNNYYLNALPAALRQPFLNSYEEASLKYKDH